MKPRRKPHGRYVGWIIASLARAWFPCAERGSRQRAIHRLRRSAMNVMTKARLDVVPLTKHIGAEIRGLDLRQKPDEDTIKAIYQAWLDHIVIIFPGQQLSQEDLIRVTGYFGEQGMPRRPPKLFPKGYSKI